MDLWKNSDKWSEVKDKWKDSGLKMSGYKARQWSKAAKEQVAANQGCSVQICNSKSDAKNKESHFVPAPKADDRPTLYPERANQKGEDNTKAEDQPKRTLMQLQRFTTCLVRPAVDEVSAPPPEKKPSWLKQSKQAVAEEEGHETNAEAADSKQSPKQPLSKGPSKGQPSKGPAGGAGPGWFGGDKSSSTPPGDDTASVDSSNDNNGDQKQPAKAQNSYGSSWFKGAGKSKANNPESSSKSSKGNKGSKQVAISEEIASDLPKEIPFVDNEIGVGWMQQKMERETLVNEPSWVKDKSVNNGWFGASKKAIPKVKPPPRPALPLGGKEPRKKGGWFGAPPGAEGSQVAEVEEVKVAKLPGVDELIESLHGVHVTDIAMGPDADANSVVPNVHKALDWLWTHRPEPNLWLQATSKDDAVRNSRSGEAHSWCTVADTLGLLLGELPDGVVNRSLCDELTANFSNGFIELPQLKDMLVNNLTHDRLAMLTALLDHWRGIVRDEKSDGADAESLAPVAAAFVFDGVTESGIFIERPRDKLLVAIMHKMLRAMNFVSNLCCE